MTFLSAASTGCHGAGTDMTHTYPSTLYRHRVNIWVCIQLMLYILSPYTDTGSTYGCAFSLCYTSCHIIQTQGQHMSVHSVNVIHLVTLYRHRDNIWMRIQFMLYILSHYTDTGSTYECAFS